jgi:hypothetical protein
MWSWYRRTLRLCISKPAASGSAVSKRRGAVVGVVLPVAEVLDEEARVVGAAGDDGARAGRGQVGVDAACQPVRPRRAAAAAQADRAVALEGGHGAPA